MSSRWRDIATPIIRGVIQEIGLKDTHALNKALIEAYPFGERKYHPYKIWLNEIRRQKGLEPPLGLHDKFVAPRCKKTLNLFGDDS